MPQQLGGYACADADRRRQDTVAQGLLNGVDDVEVDGGHPGVPAGRTLLVRCLLPLPDTTTSTQVEIKQTTLPASRPVGVTWAHRASDLAAAARTDARVSAEDVAVFGGPDAPAELLVVRTSGLGNRSPYSLVLTVADFDPRLSTSSFSFAVDCDSDLDCLVAPHCPPQSDPEPVIDYLNRDFAGLRQLLLDRLSVVTPAWTDRNAADLGVTLVEIFAYLGDYLAAAQDAVSAEAYLGTARQRVSLTRHARLLDYAVHQGAAARVWLALDVDADASAGYLRRAACAKPGEAQAMIPEGRTVRSLDGSSVFHTLHPTSPRFSRNAIDIYTWSGQECCLPVGATSATLVGTTADLALSAGDVVIFEEIRGAGGAGPVDTTHRWPVRLAEDPCDAVDPLTGTAVVQITWLEGDALPFPLCVERFPGSRCQPDTGAAVVRGNVVLAGHGATTTGPLVPAAIPAVGNYRPALDQPGLAFAAPYVPEESRTTAAAQALRIDPRDAVADVVLLSDGRDVWTLRPDLLASDRFAPDYVVEMTETGRAYLRFGDDVSGRTPTPGRTFTATYRVGGGLAGNVGAGVLTVLDPPYPGVQVRQLLPAAGGADPEPAEQVRQFAPQAFRVQQRAVTEADWATLAAGDARVQRAVATRRWTGSWYTDYVTVDRVDGTAVDGVFRAALTAELDRYRMAGGDIEITAPVFVPVEIVMTVCVAPDRFRGTVLQALIERFSTRALPGGGRGFFHPDNFTFAQPVYLSAVVAAAMAVAGVAWVDTAAGPRSPNRFQRSGQPPADELATGRIAMGRLEVARCDSEPTDPSDGRIAFVMTGGL